jgi:signal transduction protein with GAF and PtsI domain
MQLIPEDTNSPLADHNGHNLEFFCELGSRMASVNSLQSIHQRIVDFVTEAVHCDSCLVYILRGNQLVLSASKNPHPNLMNRLSLSVGQGITGWVAERREPVAISDNAWADPRFRMFHELPEDTFEAFLSVPILCRGRVAGVINLQHREAYHYTDHQIRLVATIGILVGESLVDSIAALR